jgi:hypothetical protein
MHGIEETESRVILVCVRIVAAIEPLVRDEIMCTGTADTPLFAFEFRTTPLVARVTLRRLQRRIVNFDTAARIGVYVLCREPSIALSPIVR